MVCLCSATVCLFITFFAVKLTVKYFKQTFNTKHKQNRQNWSFYLGLQTNWQYRANPQEMNWRKDVFYLDFCTVRATVVETVINSESFDTKKSIKPIFWVQLLLDHEKIDQYVKDFYYFQVCKIAHCIKKESLWSAVDVVSCGKKATEVSAGRLQSVSSGWPVGGQTTLNPPVNLVILTP